MSRLLRRTVTMRLVPTAGTRSRHAPRTQACASELQAGRAAGAEGTQARQSPGTSAHCPPRTEPFSGSGCCRHPLSLEGGPQPSAKATQSHSTTWPRSRGSVVHPSPGSSSDWRVEKAHSRGAIVQDCALEISLRHSTRVFTHSIYVRFVSSI